MKNKLVLFMTIMMMFVLAACGGDKEQTETEVATSKDTINIGVTYAPTNINPLAPVGLVSTYVSNLLFLPLVELDSNLEFQPMLADSITTEDNQTFTINLNKDAKWTDGTEITADDVIYTLELMSNSVIASNYAYMYAIVEGLDEFGYLPEGQTSISGVQKVDEKTLTVKTKNPTTLTIFQDTVGRYVLTLPKHILSSIAADAINTSDFMAYPNVTSGPYKLAKYDRDHAVELVANEAYFKGAPKTAKLNFKVLDGSQMAAQLKSGEIDMNIPSAGVIPVSDYALVKGLDSLDTSYGQPLATQHMYINENVVADALQRQAISYAMNRQMIVDNLLQGAGEATDTFFTSFSPYFQKDMEVTAYDPELAKKLLAESGWDTNKELTLSVLSGDATLELAANIIAENLKAVGIKTKIQMQDLGTLLTNIVDFNYDLAILTVSIMPVNPLPDVAFFIGEGNPNAYANAEVNAILAEIGSSVDEKEITELYKQLQVILKQDVPMPSIYANTALGAVNKRVSGATATDFGMFINVHEWTVSK